MVIGIGVTRFLREVNRILKHEPEAKSWHLQRLHFTTLCALGIPDPNPGETADGGPIYAEVLEAASRKQIVRTARSILTRRQAA